MAIQQLLQQYFLNPVGLLGILGLLPLIIFYLTRPEPERKVMPSMEFFQEDERRSKLRDALRKLQNNIVLVLNVLSILLLSLGIAGLYLQIQGQDETVIVYDRSVSMQEEHAEAVSTVLSEASTDNTVIVAGENVEVYNDLNRQAAADIIREKDPIYRQADMVSALQQARLHEGSILLLSNLGVSKSLRNSYADLGAERGLEQMGYSTENKWGIVEIGEDFVEVRNYLNKEVTISVEANSNSQEVEIGSKETQRVNTSFEEGKNTVKLSRDEFSPDNKAFVYSPQGEKITVEYQGPRNEYLSTALDSIQTVKNDRDGEILILNEEDSESFNSDRPKILMQGSSNHWSSSQTSEEDFSLNAPYNIRGKSEIFDLNPSNSSTSFSNPHNVLFRDQDTFYYNLEDEELRTSFVYPVIWKDIIHSLKSPNTFENSNKRVSRTDYSSPGFYGETAVNYLGDPNTDFNDVGSETTDSLIEENQASVIALILLIMLSSETLILLNRGVYQ